MFLNHSGNDSRGQNIFGADEPRRLNRITPSRERGLRRDSYFNVRLENCTLNKLPVWTRLSGVLDKCSRIKFHRIIELDRAAQRVIKQCETFISIVLQSLTLFDGFVELAPVHFIETYSLVSYLTRLTICSVQHKFLSFISCFIWFLKVGFGY